MQTSSRYVTTVTTPNKAIPEIQSYKTLAILEFDGTGTFPVEVELSKPVEYIRTLKLVGIYVENLTPSNEVFRVQMEPNIFNNVYSSASTGTDSMKGHMVLPGITDFRLNWPIAQFKDGLGLLRRVSIIRLEDGITFDRLVLYLEADTTM